MIFGLQQAFATLVFHVRILRTNVETALICQAEALKRIDRTAFGNEKMLFINKVTFILLLVVTGWDSKQRQVDYYQSKLSLSFLILLIPMCLHQQVSTRLLNG